MDVCFQDPTSNPYGLGDGVKYYMLEVEDWTQPSQNKRRASSRKASIDKARDAVSAIAPINIPPSLPSVIASGPPETEVEEAFRVTRSPNSQFFPVRARSSSSPGARPSSLSRLLAQAPENQIDSLTKQGMSQCHDTMSYETSHDASSSRGAPSFPPQGSYLPVHISPSHPSPPSLPPIIPSVPKIFSTQVSPLRPGSRASRLSTTSKFSGRIPALGNSLPGGSKAPPTTALTDQTLLSSSPSNDDNPFGLPVTPPREESVSDGVNIFLKRRRTTSYHVPRPSPLALNNPLQISQIPARSGSTATATNTLASLASNWGMPFGRRKMLSINSLSPTIESPPQEGLAREETATERGKRDLSARDLLRRL